MYNSYKEVIFLSFKQFTKQFLKDQTPEGDLARDINEDANFPTSDKYEDIIEHFKDCNAMTAVFDTFDRLWQIYTRNI